MMCRNDFKLWCHKVLPLVYDNSLSYYEVLCKIFNCLNTVIEQLEVLEDAREQLKDLLKQYLEDGTLDEIIKEVLSETAEDWAKKEISKVSHVSPFVAQRMFRLQRTLENTCAQSICCTENTILFLGNASGTNERQNIVECDINGNIIRDTYISNSAVGHCNGSAYLDGKIYTVDGGGGTSNISVLNYANLSFIESHSMSPHPFGMCAYEGEIYVLTLDSTHYHIQKLNRDDFTFTEMCRFILPPTVFPQILRNINQDFCIYDGYAYIVRNRNNAIFKVDYLTGEIMGVIDVPDGDGYFPFAEIESLCVFKGQVYMSSDISMSNIYGKHRYVQLFKTNIGGDALPAGYEWNDIQQYKIAVVDFNSEAKNPTGLSSDDAFASLEEFVAVYVYQRSMVFSGFSEVDVYGSSQDVEWLLLEAGDLYFNFENAPDSNRYNMRLYNGNWYINKGHFTRLGVWNSHYTGWDEVSDLFTVDASDVLFCGSTCAGLNASACKIEKTGDTQITGFGRWNRVYSNTITNS